MEQGKAGMEMDKGKKNITFKEGMLIEMFEKMKTEMAKKRETVAELI